MADTVTGLFNRGTTYKGPNQTLSSSYGQSVGIEGNIREFDDIDSTTGAGVKTKRSDRVQKCVVVRNVSGITLLPNRLVSWAAGYRGRRVDGYTTTDAAITAGLVDERLSSAGVRNYDLFWLQVAGPALVKMPLSNVIEITEGQLICALTAATSQATTAGRLRGVAVTSQVTGGQKARANAIGRAMSAKVSNTTDTTCLVDLEIMKG